MLLNQKNQSKKICTSTNVLKNNSSIERDVNGFYVIQSIFARLLRICIEQGSATPDTRAKSGTPEGFAWYAKRFHVQANFKLLRFNKFTFECMSQFQCCGFKSHSIIAVFLSR